MTRLKVILLVALVGAGIAAVVVLILLRAAPTPGPLQITISRETTYLLDAPLNPDGTVNYVAYLNKKHSKGVTRDNNAALALVHLLGPEMLPEETRDATLLRLGIKHLPAKGDYFIPLDDYAMARSPPATTRPLSKEKRWRISRVLEKAK